MSEVALHKYKGAHKPRTHTRAAPRAQSRASTLFRALPLKLQRGTVASAVGLGLEGGGGGVEKGAQIPHH